MRTGPTIGESDRGPHQAGAVETLGVSRWVRVHATRRPHAQALVCAERPLTAGLAQCMSFAELESLTERTAAGLRRSGLGRGDRVILMVPPGPEFFALAFALMRIGAVMIAVDPGMGIRRVRRALASVQAVGFVGSPKAQVARTLFRWGESSLRTVVTVGSALSHRLLRAGSRARGLDRHLSSSMTFAELVATPTSVTASDATSPPSADRADRTTQGRETSEREAAILFTSGSTGPPKGVTYSHARFEAQLQALGELYAIEPGECELATFPLFALFAPALGMRTVIPAMDFTRPGSADPRHLIELIEREHVTSMFGSPALLKRLSAAIGDRDPRLATVRRVVSAGAPVPESTLARLVAALAPGAEVHTPYGATEALPVCNIEAGELLAMASQEAPPAIVPPHPDPIGGAVCVGRPCTRMDVRLVPISDDVLDASALDWRPSTGTIGEITVAGPVVTEHYVGAPNANSLAKIDLGGTIFHRMGDLGYFDPDGRLWFCGRKSQRVRSDAGDLHTVLCEAVFNRHPQIARSALVGVEREDTARPVIVVELEPHSGFEPPPDERRIRREALALARANCVTASIEHVLFHPAFPVDPRHNAKIGREALARWASRRLGEEARP